MNLITYEIYICEAVCEAVQKKTTGTKEPDSPLTFKQHFFDVPTKSELTRPSADCQTTVFRGIKQFEEFSKKVAERSRDSDRRLRDRRPTVKQLFSEISSNLKNFRKKSLNGHATVIGGHATVGRLSNNVFSTFQANRINFEKSR